MNAPVKIAVFLGTLAAIFVVAVVLGRSVNPIAKPAPGEHGSDHGAMKERSDAADIPGGLMVAESGYTLALAKDRVAAGASVPVAFTINGPDGKPVTAYDVEHEKRLHFIAVRRDFSGFQHVHPTLSSGGTWTTDLDLTPGMWRVFADFKATGADPLTLGADLSVPGDFEPAALSGESRSSTVDGYTVTLGGELTAGTDAKLQLSVSRNGKPVTDLQPYLGAYGHLVALRAGDLAYLHVHPDGQPSDGKTKPGPEVVFYAAVPSAGTYHLYLDFKHEGKVRTAEFTLSAGAKDTPPTTPKGAGTSGDAHSGH
jgi:hypothetical protein